MCHWWGNDWNLAVSSVRISVAIRGRPRVSTGMLRHDLIIKPYHEDPGFTTEIIGVHPLRLPEDCRTRTDKVSWINGLPKTIMVYHGGTTAVQWHFHFEFFGEAVTWLTGSLRSGLLVFHLKAQGTFGHRCDCKLRLITSQQYAKYTAAYTLSKKGTFSDFTICNNNLTHDTGNYTTSLKQPNWIDWLCFWWWLWLFDFMALFCECRWTT